MPTVNKSPGRHNAHVWSEHAPLEGGAFKEHHSHQAVFLTLLYFHCNYKRLRWKQNVSTKMSLFLIPTQVPFGPNSPGFPPLMPVCPSPLIDQARGWRLLSKAGVAATQTQPSPMNEEELCQQGTVCLGTSATEDSGHVLCMAIKL